MGNHTTKKRMVYCVTCEDPEQKYLIVQCRLTNITESTDIFRPSIIIPAFYTISSECKILKYIVWSLRDGFKYYKNNATFEDLLPEHKILPKRYVGMTARIYIKMSDTYLAQYSKITRYDYLYLGYIKYIGYNWCSVDKIKSFSFAFHTIIPRCYAKNIVLTYIDMRDNSLKQTITYNNGNSTETILFRDIDEHEVPDVLSTLRELQGDIVIQSPLKRLVHHFLDLMITTQ